MKLLTHTQFTNMEEEIHFKDCILGEIYYSSSGYIMRHAPSKANNLHITNEYYHHETGCFDGSGHRLRYATQEQKDWFIACEKAQTFIPKEKVIPEIINSYQIY